MPIPVNLETALKIGHGCQGIVEGQPMFSHCLVVVATCSGTLRPAEECFQGAIGEKKAFEASQTGLFVLFGASRKTRLACSETMPRACIFLPAQLLVFLTELTMASGLLGFRSAVAKGNS